MKIFFKQIDKVSIPVQPSKTVSMNEIEKLVTELSNNFTSIIPIEKIKNTKLYWGGNGVGDRFANKKYNYTVIFSNGKTKTYSDNSEPKINVEIKSKCKGIYGIFIHSKKTERVSVIYVSKYIKNEIKKKSCVVCGSNSYIECDHKNDLYNDERVLNINTQTIHDFQALCNHCNLQKRQVCKKEKERKQIYSAKIYPSINHIILNFLGRKKHLI